ncbi:hypothetical protein MHU86_88 [Fragilaria crotonensis]|nr:hypothetical protein MHU86_88 [Fragilaria crotonensis]
MELPLHRPSETAGGSNCLGADSNEKSLSELLEPEPMEGANWIDFGEANEFHESMRHAEHLWEQEDDDNSTIPVGSDVDLGAPLTDLEDFNGSQNLDSELVDDLSALERMKELLGQEVSRRAAKYLSGRRKLSSRASTNSDEDQDSIQLELLNGRPTSTSTGRSKLHSSKGSNMTASTAPMYGDKPRKSKKSSKEDKKKKKKRRSRSRDGDDTDSGDDVCLTYQPLGESDDPNPVAILGDDGEDPLTQLLQKAV